MNKMLEALKQLQAAEANSAESTAVAGKRPVRRAGSAVPTNTAPSKKFDVSSWADSVPVVPRVETVAAPTPTPPPAPARFESPWERAARHDLSIPLQARGYQTTLLRWREDLPGTHPRAVFIAGVGCEESDVAEFALRLGMEQARNGETTLLVDAEPSRWLSNALVALDQPGLAEAYLENIPTRHFLQPTFTDGLKLLPAGANVPDVERNSATLAKLVNDLKAQAQWTIISAANAGSHFAADLARASDAVYLLVRLGSATNLEATRVRQHLQQAGARLLGCIALDGTHV